MSDKQSALVRRIQSICDEFNSRAIETSVAVARVEIAKALAESESTIATITAERDSQRERIRVLAEEFDQLARKLAETEDERDELREELAQARNAAANAH